MLAYHGGLATPVNDRDETDARTASIDVMLAA
jgi:hypothetical protein